jgi:hypothetical protein
MSNDTTYNGWTNYETWAVNLHIDNEQHSQEQWREQAQHALEENDFDKDDAANDLARILQADHEGEAPEDLPGVFGDLLRAALGAVNWYEIAEHMLSDLEVWTAGWNMPGYLPESEPARFLSAGEAAGYILDAIGQHADEAVCSDDNEGAEALEAFAGDVNSQRGEFSAQCGNLVYWVAKA